MTWRDDPAFVEWLEKHGALIEFGTNPGIAHAAWLASKAHWLERAEDVAKYECGMRSDVAKAIRSLLQTPTEDDE